MDFKMASHSMTVMNYTYFIVLLRFWTFHQLSSNILLISMVPAKWHYSTKSLIILKLSLLHAWPNAFVIKEITLCNFTPIVKVLVVNWEMILFGQWRSSWKIAGWQKAGWREEKWIWECSWSGEVKLNRC